ncbi:hypothetical protein AB0B07_18670 [Streptomyces sioyaensis]|uniref:hypothetical protein n=1 Tax=Streptomyces sioyaensis TaxID=67364 RepID=UPI003406FAE3
MPTHSPAEEGQQSTATLPISFDRKFRPWRYAIGHSELKLRSIDSGTECDFIEVTFYGVVGMRLKTVYRPLTIALAEPAETDEMLKFSEVRESQSSRVHCLALKSESGDGLVACLSYSIWSHPRETDEESSDVPHRESALILRG